jgi:hypothetical protein
MTNLTTYSRYNAFITRFSRIVAALPPARVVVDSDDKFLIVPLGGGAVFTNTPRNAHMLGLYSYVVAMSSQDPQIAAFLAETETVAIEYMVKLARAFGDDGAVLIPVYAGDS